MTQDKKHKIYLFLFPFLALMSPIIGNLNGVFGTLLSQESHLSSGAQIWFFILIFSLIAFFLGMMIVVVDSRVQPNGKRMRFARDFLVSGVVFLSLDLSYGGIQVAENIMPFAKEFYALRIFKVFFAVMVFGFIIFLVKVLWANLPVILTAIFAAFFLSSVLLWNFSMEGSEDVAKSPSNIDVTKPPIIHIILDEMIGAEGIERNIPEGEELYRKILKFYKRFGFRLYGKAFSRHFWTGMSLPNMMNFDFTDVTYGTQSKYLARNEWKYFDTLQKRGYSIKVYQSRHLDFCSAQNVNVCKTFSSFNPASIYFSPPKDYVDKSLPVKKIVFRVFLQRVSGSYLARSINRIIKMMDNDPYLAERFDVQSFDLWFDKFQRDALITQGGEVFFAHFLVPHAPFLLNGECETKSIPWLEPHHLKEVKGLEGEPFNKSREYYYQLYFEQASCIYKKLTQFMEHIEELPQFNDATIIIHGDHGSRISAGQFSQNLSGQDYVDNYSTLFAIRSPNIDPGYDPRKVSVQRLFTELIQPEGSLPSGNEDDWIAANSMEKGKVVLVGMPEFGAPAIR